MYLSKFLLPVILKLLIIRMIMLNDAYNKIPKFLPCLPKSALKGFCRLNMLENAIKIGIVNGISTILLLTLRYRGRNIAKLKANMTINMERGNSIPSTKLGKRNT